MGTVNSTSIANSTIIAHQKIQKPFDFRLLQKNQYSIDNIPSLNNLLNENILPVHSTPNIELEKEMLPSAEKLKIIMEQLLEN